jgi:glutamate-1-semialdehyde 2,1-aminomutase
MTQLQSVDVESLLEIETQMFLSRTPRSKEIFEKAIQIVPSGVHSNYRLTDPYPLYITRSNGSKLWDADGNIYLDFNMGFGALVTGHSHPKLTEAVTEQIRELGTIYGFEYSETVKLADLMCKRFSVNRIKFSSTGAEGTMHAIRFARAFTKRKKILKFEGCYHGSHDGLLVSVKPAKEKSGNAPKRYFQYDHRDVQRFIFG